MKKSDSCYQKAVLSGDAENMLGLENRFVSMEREALFECMVLSDHFWLYLRVQPLFYVGKLINRSDI